MGVWPNVMGVIGALVVMVSVAGIAIEEKHLGEKERAVDDDSSIENAMKMSKEELIVS